MGQDEWKKEKKKHMKTDKEKAAREKINNNRFQQNTWAKRNISKNIIFNTKNETENQQQTESRWTTFQLLCCVRTQISFFPSLMYQQFLFYFICICIGSDLMLILPFLFLFAVSLSVGNSTIVKYYLKQKRTEETKQSKRNQMQDSTLSNIRLK